MALIFKQDPDTFLAKPIADLVVMIDPAQRALKRHRR